jgi:hypothetical protein
MSGPDDSRRAFLTGSTVVAASAAFGAEAAAQSKMVINDPSVVREIEAESAGYDRALGNNDVAALNGFFFDSPLTIRYGIAENLYGYPEIQAFRSAVVASGVGPRRERTVITTCIHAVSAAAVRQGRPDDANLGSVSARLAHCRRACQRH